jgi:hypothetical protein
LGPWSSLAKRRESVIRETGFTWEQIKCALRPAKDRTAAATTWRKMGIPKEIRFKLEGSVRRSGIHELLRFCRIEEEKINMNKPGSEPNFDQRRRYRRLSGKSDGLAQKGTCHGYPEHFQDFSTSGVQHLSASVFDMATRFSDRYRGVCWLLFEMASKRYIVVSRL